MFNVTYQAGGRFDYPYYPTKGKPFIKGRRVPINEAIVKDEYTVPEDMELITVSIGASRYHDSDHWSLKINGELIFDTIYTKDVPEGFYFMVVREVKAGQVIEFIFHNDSGSSKTVWLNYQFLKD